MIIDLNTREAALLVWMGIFIAIIFVMRSTRSSAIGVIKAFLAPKVFGIVLAAVAYTAGCTWLLSRADIWSPRNLKTVAFWFAGTAFVALININELEKDRKTLNSLAAEVFAVSALVIFLGGMEPFPFWAEFLLLPFLTCVGMMAVMAGHRSEHAILVRPLSWILSAVGLVIVTYSLYRVYDDWQRFEALHQAREFGVPIALSLMFLPFLYGLLLMMAYENAAISLCSRIKDRKVRRYAWFRGILSFGLHRELFKRYMQAIKMAGPISRAEVRQSVRDLKNARQREKNPPGVDWAQGWSPYETREFLADRGLLTGFYSRSMAEWAAESCMLNIGGGIFPDRLAYRILGTETAVTELSLVLNVNSLEATDRSDTLFYEAAGALVSLALGDETADRFLEAVRQDERASMKAGDFRLLLTRDDWGVGGQVGYSRRFTVLHPARGYDGLNLE